MRGHCEYCNKFTVEQEKDHLKNGCLKSKGYLKYYCSRWVKNEEPEESEVFTPEFQDSSNH